MKHKWKKTSHFHPWDYEYRCQKIDFYPGPKNSHMLEEGMQSYYCNVDCVNMEGRPVVVHLRTHYKKHMIFAIDRCLDKNDFFTSYELSKFCI